MKLACTNVHDVKARSQKVEYGKISSITSLIGRDIKIDANEVKETDGDQCKTCGEGEGMINEEDFNYQAQMRPARDPAQPIAKERAEHEALHFPYRAWCPHCVRGRGVSSHHTMRKEGPEEKGRRVPVIGMDYGFLGKSNEKTNPIT